MRARRLVLCLFLSLAITVTFIPNTAFATGSKAGGQDVSTKTSTSETKGHAHSMEYYGPNDPTCTSEGNVEYWYCADCGRYFADKDAEHEFDEGDWVRSKAKHALVHYDAVKATAKAPGNIEYWRCSDCGAVFKDDEAREECAYEDVVVEAKRESLAKGGAKAGEPQWDVPETVVKKAHQGKGTDLSAYPSIYEQTYDAYTDFEYAWYKNPEGQKEFIKGNSSYYLKKVTETQDWYCDVRLIESPEEVKTIHFEVILANWYTSIAESNIVVTKEDVKEGNKIDLTVEVEGLEEGETPAFSWRKYFNDENGQYQEEYIDCDEATYQATAGPANYQVDITVGDDTLSEYFCISVDTNLQVENGNDTITVNPGESAELSVEATAEEGVELSYQWYDKDGSKLESETSNTLTVSNINEYTYYVCRVSDAYGNCIDTYRYINIDSGLKIEDADKEIHVNLGESLELSVQATANDGVEICYQWLDDSWREIEGETSSTLTVSDIQERTRYICRVTDEYGNTYYAYRHIYIDSGLQVEYPDSITVNPGGSVDLSVVATANEGVTLSYQWYDKDWNKLEGETSKTLTVSNIRAYTYYICRVRDSYGNEQDVWHNIYVDSGLQINGTSGTTVKPGESAELSVSASAYEGVEIYYQWYDKAWNKLEGETNNTLVVSNVQKSAEYMCSVTDEYGNQQNAWVSVQIDSGLQVDDSYQYITVKPGDSVELSVDATAYDGVQINYQWLDDDWEELEGETSSTLNLTNVRKATQYICRVTDEYGNRIDAQIYIQIDSGLWVEDTHETVNVSFGGSTELGVNATANDGVEITYQWYEVDADNGSWNTLDGETSSTITVSDVRNYSTFVCRITDDYGNEQEAWRYIEIDTGLKVLDYSETVTVTPGASVELSVNATANDGVDIYYQWYDEDGDPIEGATSSKYTVNNVRKTTEYSCGVSDDYGNTRYAYRDVEIDTGFYMEDSYEYIYVKPGDTVELSVNATANEGVEIQYQWYKESDLLEGETNKTLQLNDVQEYARYKCKVSDGYGNWGTAWRYVSIDSGLQINDYEEEIKVNLGDTVELSVNATAYEGVEIHYQWYDEDWNEIEGATSSTLTIPNVQTYSEYICEVSDNYGNQDEAYRYIRIDSGLKVETNGEDFYVAPGENQDLIINATSSDPDKITYEWFRYVGDEDEGHWESVDSTSMDNPGTLTVKADNPEQGYRCRVNDGYGYIVTKWFWVYLDIELDLEYEENVTVSYGGNATLTVTPISSIENDEFTYKWLDSRWETIEGANTGKLELQNIQEAGQYECVVTDKYGCREYATIKISIENGFELQYEDEVTIEPGDTATLKVTVKATDPEDITYRWMDEEGEETYGRTDTLEVTRAGWYYCRVTDKYGNSKRAKVHVIVDNNLTLTIQTEDGTAIDPDEEITIQPGDEVKLKAVVNAIKTDKLRYYWYYDDNDEYETIGREESITITPTMTGWYVCEVNDGYSGWKNERVRIKVDSGFSAAADGDSTFIINEGDSVTAKVKATTSEGDLTYRWYDDDYDEISEARNQTEYTFAPMKSGFLYCRVSDGVNTEEIEFYVQIETGLKVEYDRTVAGNEGEPLTLSVKATTERENATITYQWYLYYSYEDEDGGYYDRIGGATKSEYTVKLPKTAKYRCKVSDGVNTENADIDVIVENIECSHPKLAHTAAAAATCTKAGNIEYWYCDDCGKYFSDASATTQIKKADTATEALGHKWGTTKYEWADDYSKVTATRACANNTEDSCTETETVKTSSEETAKASCEAKGVTKYTATFKNGAFEAQTKNKEEPALGHDWDNGAVTTQPGCETAGVKTFTCKRDATHKKTETVDPIGHDWDNGAVTTEPGCETAGVKTFTCKRDATHTRTETVDPIGHEWGAWEVATPSTCVLEGQEVRTCTHDPNHKDYRKSAKLAHQLSHVEGVAATCETGGVKEYWTCSECQGIFSDKDGKTQITETDLQVAALGHDYGDWMPLNENQHQKVCSHDNTHVETADHVWGEGVVTKEATETETGVKTFTCSVCGQERTEVIPMLDKDPITPSDAAADQAKINKKIPKVNAKKISTTANIKKKTMTIKFPASDVVTNYRIQYRITGKSAWNNVWSAGTGKYTIKGLKKYTCCQFRIAGYVKQEDGTWESSEWSDSAYRFMSTVSLKKVKTGKKAKTIDVTWAKVSKATGYEVLYSQKKNMKGAKIITITKNKTTKCTLTKLKSGKKYYVKVRPIKKVKDGNGKTDKTYIGVLTKAKYAKAK